MLHPLKDSSDCVRDEGGDVYGTYMCNAVFGVDPLTHAAARPINQPPLAAGSREPPLPFILPVHLSLDMQAAPPLLPPRVLVPRGQLPVAPS